MFGMQIAPMAFGLVAACSPETLEISLPQDAGPEPAESSYTEPENYELPSSDIDQDENVVFRVGPVEFTIVDEGFDADDDGTGVKDRPKGPPQESPRKTPDRPDRPNGGPDA